jgi:hypothetical protein
VTAVTTHRGLPGRLEYLLAEVVKVADSGVVTSGFAAAVALHLERALCEATVMAAELEALHIEIAGKENR